MKYNITINQKAVRDNNWNLKANHMAVLQVVCEWVINSKCLKIQDDKGTWFWVSHKFIIDELPMFDVKERRCLDLIKDLESCQLLELNPNNKQLGRTFMRVGLNYEKLNSDYAKDCEAPQKNAYPTAKKCVPPTQKIADYNNTNDNNTNNNTSSLPPEEKEIKGFNLAGQEREQNPITPHEKTLLTIEETKEKFLQDKGLFELFVRATKLERKNFDKAVDKFIEHVGKIKEYPRAYDRGNDDSKSHFKFWFVKVDSKEFEMVEPKPIIIPPTEEEKAEERRLSREKLDAYTASLKAKKDKMDEATALNRKTKENELRQLSKVSANLSAKGIPSYLLP